MENASKALLMAAGVLIGILILSLAVYLFASFGAASAEIHKDNETNQTEQFNTQFTSYEGKDGITIYDVITVANLATENNIYYEFPKRSNIPNGNDRYITVILGNKRIEYGLNTSTDVINTEYNTIIKNELDNMQPNSDPNQSELIQYSCKVDISSTTQRVYKVTFTKK